MGMESYFIKLTVKGEISKDSLTTLFIQKYDVSKYKIPSGRLLQRGFVDDSRFVMDHKAVVAITALENETEVTVECCFANFERNLSYIYDVAQWVSSLGKETKLTVLTSEYDFNSLDFEAFRSIVTRSYHAKLSQFNARYGTIKEDILPNQFYKRIRRTGFHRKNMTD